MGHVRHDIHKHVNVAHGHIKDFDEIDKQHKMAFITAIALILIFVYFWFNFLRFDQLVKSIVSGKETTSALIGILPHLIVLALLGTPIIRFVLKAVKLLPFYVPRHKRKKLGYKKYRIIRLKRFTVYFIISLIVSIAAMLFIYTF